MAELRIVRAGLYLALASSLALPAACKKAEPPEKSRAAPALEPTGWVTDAADILSTGEEQALSRKLANFETRTMYQMAVVTTPSLNGRDILGYTRDLANTWGVGRQGANDGIVILVAPVERKARIAVGLGLEDDLPNALLQSVMRERMVPRFSEGKHFEGIDAGADALIDRLDR